MSVDYPDYATPQAHANSIAATGVPLLTGATNLANPGPVVLGPSASQVIGPVSITQIGYEVSVAVLANGASTSPFAEVQMKWTDSATGFVTGLETWWLAGSSTAGGQEYYGTGPSKGDTLTVTLTNGDTANNLTVTFAVGANSRAYVRDDWRQQTMATVPSFTNGNYDQPASFLIQTAPTVTAGAAATRILPLYCGQVRLWASCIAAFDVSVNAVDRNITSAPAGNQIFEDSVTAAGGGFMSDQFALPRCTCTLVLKNNGGANQVIGATVIISEVQP